MKKQENKNERNEAIERAILQIEKQFGKGAIMKMGEAIEDMNVETFSSGSIGLDRALGVGGIPRGRIVEVYGPESAGKTLLTLHMIAEVQKEGGIAGFIDAEHALDPIYAEKIGVNINELYISQPDSGEQALEICETMVRSGALDLIVIDSVAALTPKAEIDGEMGDAHVALQARLMSQALRKLTSIVNNSKCTVVFINQLREKVGVMFGNNETTVGGRALKFYSSIRLDVRKIETIKESGNVIGHRARIKVVKNKVAPPMRQAEIDIIYGVGFDKYGEVVDIAVENNIIDKSGAWFSYNGNKIGQGRANTIQFLKDHEDIFNEIKEKL